MAGCFLDGCFLGDNFLDDFSLDGCSLDGCFWPLVLIKLPKEKMDAQATLSIYLLATKAPTQSVRLPLITFPSLCSTCMTYGTPCHSIGHQVLPTQPLEEDFPSGNRYFRHVSLLTYLKEIYMVDPIYVLESPTVFIMC